jgi:hypothetical protein
MPASIMRNPRMHANNRIALGEENRLKNHKSSAEYA